MSLSPTIGHDSPRPMDFPKGPELFDLLRRWTDYLKVREMAETTIRQYRRTLINFVADTLSDPRALSEDDIVSYLGLLPRKGHSRGMVLRALKSFYKWWEDRGGYDPTHRLRIGKPKYGPAPNLPESEVKRLIACAAAREPRRGWAIQLAYLTGGRASSLCALEPRDIQGDHLYFRVTKGDRPYAVPLVAEAKDAATCLASLGHETLFGVGPGQFWNWVKQAAKDAGVTAWPHLLRHSFVTKVYKATKDPLVTSKLAGHNDLSQMPRYAHVEDDRAGAMRKAFG